ncbi:MAG: alpha-N-arabinofuranosidase [Planctomycetales bacterium]|nr:alpha-N-arabinofuranosidase [Planctomycetales bacterium]
MLARRAAVGRTGLFLLAFVAACVTARAVAAAETLEATGAIEGDQPAGRISRHLYGHFAEHLGRCVYDGIWVGEDSRIPNTRGIRNDVVEALRAIAIPNLRWPGGCYADNYHWRDGIGPRVERPHRINTHWGGVIDTNAFGTHEFLDLCEQIGADPYIAGNVGSGTPAEMRDWIEYMTFAGDSELANLRRANGRDEPWKIPYFGVGNENWGCGGNMRPEYYADLYRRFSTYCNEYSGNRLRRVACGPGGENTAWTRIVMQRAGDRMQALSQHYYTLAASWSDKRPATGFDEEAWFAILRDALKMEDRIVETVEIMDEYDPRGRVKLYVDEWGTWYRNEPGTNPGFLYQQNSQRDALVAALTFHIFHEHAERVTMANIAQTVNVLQAMILTEGPAMVLTPTYYVFEMYKVHHDAQRLPVTLTTPDYTFGDAAIPAISASASRDRQGAVHVSFANSHATQAVAVSLDLTGVNATSATGRVLVADSLDAHNTFENPNRVKPAPFDGAKIADGKLTVELPAASVVVLELK